MSNRENTVSAIIGGGPVGLAAAAHVLAAVKPVVLEAGDKVGHAVRQWSHVRMFSPLVLQRRQGSRGVVE